MSEHFILNISDRERQAIAQQYVKEVMDAHARYVFNIADGTTTFYPTPGEPSMLRVQQRPCDYIECSDFADEELEQFVNQRLDDVMKELSRVVASALPASVTFERRKVGDFARILEES